MNEKIKLFLNREIEVDCIKEYLKETASVKAATIKTTKNKTIINLDYNGGELFGICKISLLYSIVTELEASIMTEVYGYIIKEGSSVYTEFEGFNMNPIYDIAKKFGGIITFNAYGLHKILEIF